jgi:hypothetical protein
MEPSICVTFTFREEASPLCLVCAACSLMGFMPGRSSAGWQTMGFWADCTLTCMACVCIPVHLICTVSDCDPAVEMVCDLLAIDARISTSLAVNHSQSLAKKNCKPKCLIQPSAFDCRIPSQLIYTREIGVNESGLAMAKFGRSPSRPHFLSSRQTLHRTSPLNCSIPSSQP